MKTPHQLIIQWRGRLPIHEPGARGFEHWARNTECDRLAALTLCGISPATALTRIYEQPLQEGQSPFAIQIGRQFERQLFEQQAAKLQQLYVQSGRLTPPLRVLHLDTHIPAHRPNAMAQRRKVTQDLLQRKMRGERGLPHLIIHARLTLTVLGQQHDIEPDFLIASDEDSWYRLGEIKSFSDRGPKTPSADLRGALRQVAVGVLCLRQLLQRTGHRALETYAPPIADLVLKKPGSMHARLHTMTLQQECRSIEMVVQQAQTQFQRIATMLSAHALDPCLEHSTHLDAIPNNFYASCKEFCALADQCKAQARQSSQLIFLGARARETLLPAQTITRALELLQENLARPLSAEEEDLAQQLQDAQTLLGRSTF